MTEDWREQAQCRGHDTGLFNGRGDQSVRAARRICRRCPVIRECLDEAMRHDERHGVWGGTSPTQRTNLRNRLARERVAS